MNQKIIKWAIHDRKQWPGGFRQKDLELLFADCCQKYKKLLQLNKQKQDLSTRFVPKEDGCNQTGQTKQVSKINQETLRKKVCDSRFKCQLKSCGKVMNSESSYIIHMKKHNEKRGRKYDYVQGSHQLYQDQ